MKRLSNMIKSISMTMDNIAGFFMFIVMLLVVSNILLRLLFNHPIKGTYELVGLLTAVVVGLGLAYCAFKNGHIEVEFVLNLFPEKLQHVILIVNHAIGFCLWSFVTWNLVKYGNEMMGKGLVTATSEVPIYPFIYIIAFGFLALSLVNLQRLILSIKELIEKKVIVKKSKQLNVAQSIGEDLV